MKKKKDIIIFASSCLVLGIVLFFTIRNYNTLPEFKADAVDSIILSSSKDGDKEIQDVETFLKYYNQIHDVEDLIDGEICTPDYFLDINLKSGGQITLIGGGRELEIVVSDSRKKSVKYRGTQENIENLLLHGEY